MVGENSAIMIVHMNPGNHNPEDDLWLNERYDYNEKYEFRRQFSRVYIKMKKWIMRSWYND